MEELRVPCPSGLRTRYLKDYTTNQLLYAVNCMPASAQGGLYLWRPQLDPNQAVRAVDSAHKVFDTCRFRDGIAVVHGDTSQNKLMLTLVRKNATGLYVPDSKWLSPFKQANIKEVTVVQAAHSLIAIATDYYGLIFAEVDDDFQITDWYIGGGLISGGSIGSATSVTVTGARVVVIDDLRWSGLDLSSSDALPVYISTVTYYCAIRNGTVNQYEVYVEFADENNIRDVLPERYSALPLANSPWDSMRKAVPIEFSLNRKVNLLHSSNTVGVMRLYLYLDNKSTTNSETLYIAKYESGANGLPHYIKHTAFHRTTRVFSIGGIPVCNTTSYIHSFSAKLSKIGKVGASSSYLVAPSTEDAVAIGDPVSLKFTNEVPLQGKVTDIRVSGSTAIVSTTAESYAVPLQEGAIAPTVILPSSYDRAIQTTSGVFILFKGRIFRVIQNSGIEITSTVESYDADDMTYIDDYGILLLTRDGSEEMLVYAEAQGKWVYWRFDEIGGGVRAIEYNDGILLCSDGMAYRLSHEQLDTSYETALYVFTEPLSNLQKFAVQALELEGDLFVSDEQNAKISVTSFADNQSAYLVQQLGTPWWNTPPFHAFSAGGTSGQHTGANPVTTEPFQGQPTIFTAELQGIDLGSTVYQTGSVFPTGRRFLIGINIGKNEKKSHWNLLLGFKLYGKTIGSSLVG